MQRIIAARCFYFEIDSLLGLFLVDPGKVGHGAYNVGEVLFGGELDSTGLLEVQVACRGLSVGHVKS